MATNEERGKTMSDKEKIINASNEVYEMSKVIADNRPFAFALYSASKEEYPGKLCEYWEITSRLSEAFDELLIMADKCLDTLNTISTV